MIKKITIYTVKSGTASKSFTTKRLATEAKEILDAFGVETEIVKETKTITLD